MKTLSVLPNGSAMVPHYESFAAGRRAYIGLTWDESFANGVNVSGGWVVSKEPVVITPATHEFLNEYLLALRSGDLLPADDATAALCGKPKPTKSALVKLTDETIVVATPDEGSDDHG